MTVTTRDRLRSLVDELPESELHAAERFLQYLRQATEEPFLHALGTAKLDDEPETPEEAAAVEIARQQAARGEVVP